MAVDRKQLMMGGAAGVALIVALWSLWPSSSPAPTTAAPARAAAPARGPGAAAGGLAPMAPVKLAELTATRQGPGEAERNPFRFQPRVVAPPPRPQVVAPPVQIVETPRAPSPPPGPPPAPPIPLKFTGLLERENGVKWAVLTDGKSVMFGKDGDIIDGRYTIVKIGTESIEMTYVDGRGRQVIRLTGQ